jgi:hypothetical protein
MCIYKTCNKFRIGKYLPYTFPIQNDLKEGDALSPLLYNFASGYTIRKVHEIKVGLKLNWTHQLWDKDLRNLLRKG